MKTRSTTGRALSLGDILAEIKLCSGTQFDAAVVEAFVRFAARGGEEVVTSSAVHGAEAPATRLRRPKHFSRRSLSSHHVGLIVHSPRQASGLRA